jgi:hypothetical protein
MSEDSVTQKYSFNISVDSASGEAKLENNIDRIEQVDEDKATEKVTLYLTYVQRDKMDNLAIEYKRRTRRRTDANKLMRIIIDRVSIEDLL